MHPSDCITVMRLVSFPSPLTHGVLLNRINRFVAQVEIRGDIIECYMANPGSMLGMCVAGSPVGLSETDAPGRKFKFTVECVQISGVWIGCNTSLANRAVGKLLRTGGIRSLATFRHHKAEKNAGDSRVDFFCWDEAGNEALIEVKTVTMASDWFRVESENKRAARPFHRFPLTSPPECHGGDKHALFPDCESVRAQKHVRNLIHLHKQPTMRCVLLYVIMRDDVVSVGPSAYCDPLYTQAIRDATDLGVEFVAIKCKIIVDGAEPGIDLVSFVPAILPQIQTPNLPSGKRKRK
jgi:sugar fermentation stimulation protein A